MDLRLEKLLNAFYANGWALIGPVDTSDWWFSDILHLVSNRRPVGTNIYLTSLTDPEFLDKKIVWCVGVSTEIPDNRSFTFIDQVSLNDIKKINLNDFVKKINKAVLVCQ
jgi:hypothetical protein